jgi:hypothetical protein
MARVEEQFAQAQSVLPDPVDRAIDPRDLISALSMLENDHALSRVSTVRTALAKAQSDERLAHDAERRAAYQASREQEQGSKFDSLVSTLGTVAKVAAAVAAVASVVASGGASAIAIIALVGVAMSASSPIMRSAGCDAKVCDAVEIGGTALSVVGGFGCASAASGATQAGSSAWSATAQSAHVVEAGAHGASGAAHIKAGQAHAAAAQSQADATAQQFAAGHSVSEQKDWMEELHRTVFEAQLALEAIVDIQLTGQAATRAVIQNIGRRA